MKGVTHLYPNEQVASNVYDYASKCSLDLPEDVLEYHQRTAESNPRQSIMMISPLQAQSQVWIAKTLGSKRILEIGTFLGFSALTWAHAIKGQEGGKVVTLELDPEASTVAREIFARTGTDECIELIEGDARTSLKSLHTRNLPSFDLVFLDADKTSYVAYLELILALSQPGSTNRLLRAGGIIMADNVLRYGLVADASEANPWHNHGENNTMECQILDEFNKKMKSDKRLEALLMPVFDGLGLARLVD